MASYTLGQAAIVDKGEWGASTAYVLLNQVTHNGGSFLCKLANTGVEPGVTSGWESNWTMVSRGILSFNMTFPSDGIATFTITFCDGSTESFSTSTSTVTVDSEPTSGSTNPVSSGGVYTALHSIDGATQINSGSITTTQIKDGTIATADLANNCVTGAKVTVDSTLTGKLIPALYSPVNWASAALSLTSSHRGHTILISKSVTVTLTQSVSAAMAVGTEIAFAAVTSGSSITAKIYFNGVRIVRAGTTGYAKSKTISLTEPGAMVAIKKITTDSTNGDLWLLTGAFEE